MTTSPGLVASAVRAEIARAGETQSAAARVINVSNQAMSKKARGLTPFRVEELTALAAWLDVPVTTLMGEHSGSHVPAPARPAAQGIPA